VIGHVLPPSSIGLSELDTVKWEVSVIKEVLAGLPPSFTCITACGRINCRISLTIFFQLD